MGLVNFRLLTPSLLVFNCLSLPYHIFPISLKNESSSSIQQGLASGTSVSAGSTQAQMILRPPFLSSHLQLTHSLPRDRLTHNCPSLWGQLPRPTDSIVCLFLLFFLFFLLPEKIANYFLYNLRYYVTFCFCGDVNHIIINQFRDGQFLVWNPLIFLQWRLTKKDLVMTWDSVRIKFRMYI